MPTASSAHVETQRAQDGGLPCLHTGVASLGGASFSVTERQAPATSGARWTLVAAVATQAAMVLTASTLSVFRPGGPIRGAAYRSPMRRRAQERA
jgi:hypothetical protein